MPTKSEWKTIVKNAEKEAERLAEKHPRSVLGAHWRDSVAPQTDYQSQLRQDSQDASRAKSEAHSESLALQDAHMKHVGIYSKAACEGRGDCLHSSRATGTDTKHADGSQKQHSASKKLTPARYPAVSFYAQLREEDPQYRKNYGKDKHSDEKIEEHQKSMARLRLETKHSMRKSDSSRVAHKPESFQDYLFRLFTGKSGLSEDSQHARASQLYNVPRDEYADGGRPDHSEHVVQDAQENLARKWLEMMRHPPPVNRETRPDMLDPRSLVLPRSDFKKKRKELLDFKHAIQAYENDPQFNPVIVMQAHNLVKYGILPPESDRASMWRAWYMEITDKYRLLSQEVAALATPHVSRDMWDHGEPGDWCGTGGCRTLRRRVMEANRPPRPDQFAAHVANDYEQMQARGEKIPQGVVVAEVNKEDVPYDFHEEAEEAAAEDGRSQGDLARESDHEDGEGPQGDGDGTWDSFQRSFTDHDGNEGEDGDMKVHRHPSEGSSSRKDLEHKVDRLSEEVSDLLKVIHKEPHGKEEQGERREDARREAARREQRFAREPSRTQRREKFSSLAARGGVSDAVASDLERLRVDEDKVLSDRARTEGKGDEQHAGRRVMEWLRGALMAAEGRDEK